VSRGCAAAALLLCLTGCEPAPDQAPAPRPTLYLLSGLPIAFGEGFTLDAPPSPVMTALARDYRVVAVDGPESLPPTGLLLAAQPRALTPERLAALDAWVRGGGRLVLLADPRLTWPSDLAIGDKRRPPYTFADTGLLAHWGLRSEAPAPGATSVVQFSLAGRGVESDSPGTLAGDGRTCAVATDRRSADCGLGAGRAWVVADADFLRLPGGTEALLAAMAAIRR